MLSKAISLLVLQTLFLQGFGCPSGIVCVHDNDGTEVCAEQTSTGINCPAGTHIESSTGSLIPICASGNVACIQQNDQTSFCFPGYICPSGSIQVGPVNLPTCPNNQQLCVYGSMYGCFDGSCPPGMTPIGTIDCTIPPKSCASTEKLCLYNVGSASACQSVDFDCWPGTHEWTPCDSTLDSQNPTLDFETNQIKLANSHFIKCFNGLTKNTNDGSVSCGLPMFDTILWPTVYSESKLLYLSECYARDSSFDWFLPIMEALNFSSVLTGYFGPDGFKVPDSWFAEYNLESFNFAEYCYVDGQVLFWTDPRCNSVPDNSNCYPDRITMYP